MTESNTNKTAKGVIWNTIERFSTIGFNILCTAIVASFLTPDDFGVVGMLTIFTSIGQNFVDSGFSSALIREKKVSDEEYSSILYFNFFIGVVVYGILFLASSSIADFYELPILSIISKITFLTLPISALGLVQMTILAKAMEFKKLAIITVLSGILSGVVAITIAYYTKSVWALVFQNLSLYLFRTILLWVFSKWRPILYFSWLAVKSKLKFAMNILCSHLISSVFKNLNSLLIGKFYTPADLGFYSQASKLSNAAADNFTNVVTRVTYPALLKVSDNDDHLRAAYIKCIKCTVLFVGFFSMLFAGIAKEIFLILYGSGWDSAALFFQILCFVGTLYPLHSINQNILLLKGKGNTVLKLEIIRRCVFIVLIFIAVHFDVVYMVWCMALYSVIELFINMPVCGKPINYTIHRQLADVFPIYVVITAMFCVELITPQLSDYLLINVIIKLFLGILCFLFFASIICRKSLMLAVNAGRTIVKR